MTKLFNSWANMAGVTLCVMHHNSSRDMRNNIYLHQAVAECYGDQTLEINVGIWDSH